MLTEKEIKITLILNENTVTSLNSFLICKHMAGSFYGIQDQFIDKIIKAIHDNKDEVTLKLKDVDI